MYKNARKIIKDSNGRDGNKKEGAEDNVLPALMVEHATIEAARDINNYVTPCSDATAPITVAALRYVADIIERELLDVEQAEIAKKTQEALHRSTKVVKEEKKANTKKG